MYTLRLLMSLFGLSCTRPKLFVTLGLSLSDRNLSALIKFLITESLEPPLPEK